MKQQTINSLCAVFSAQSANESLARVLTAGFLLPYPVSTEELADVKTAVSEAVTNAIVHGYRSCAEGRVKLDLKFYASGRLKITVTDWGRGIEDVERARAPFFTTDREHERGGMGFSIMEAFMDRVRVTSAPMHGTRVVLERTLAAWK